MKSPCLLVGARWTRPLLVAGILAGAGGCSGSTTLESSKDPSTANPLDDKEKAVLTALIGYRDKNSIAAVANCASLNVSASAHSDDMRDHAYPVSDTGQDGSTVQTRSCKAGYQGGCGATVAMAELVSSGISDPDAIITQWSGDPKTNAILLNPALLVVGVGQGFGAAPPVWTVDFGGQNEASCNP